MTSISQNTEHFEVQIAFIVRNPGRVSLPEFPTSATVYVTILSNDQVMPNVKSVNNLDSFTIIPTGLSNEHAWYLTICTNILRKTCDEDARDVTCPKPLTQITKSKTLLVCVTMMNPIQRKGRGT